MKVVRFKIDNLISYGFIENDSVLEVSGSPFEENHYVTGREFPIVKVRLLAPVKPSKIIAVGLNYKDHAEELNMKLPDEPIIFLKPPTSIIGPNENIIIPVQSKQIDYEAELAFVVGKEAKNVPIDIANDYIYGFTCANDVTARDLQEIDGQWSRAKSFDTFCPIGPWIETKVDSISLDITLKVNDKLKQNSNTFKRIFNDKQLLSFISKIMTLYPGDIVLTGTPPGVGSLKNNDKIKINIDSIGHLKSTVSN